MISHRSLNNISSALQSYDWGAEYIQEKTMKNIIVTILGRSGAGKSSSIRNLDPATTAIISTDAKPLPFKGSGKFENIVEVNGENPELMFAILDKLANNTTIKTVVIDAFTQWGEAMSFFFNKKFRGFDRQNAYNDAVFTFWDMLPKLKGKIVYVFAHPVIGETYDGEDTIVAKVDNKQRKGIIEERSTVVLMARSIKDGEEMKYIFETKSNGKTPTKAPPGMFEGKEIENDLEFVNKRIEEYYE